MVSDLSDSELVRQAQAGDAEAYGHLVRRYQEKVYMLALQMTHNHADADELSQQAFLRGFQSINHFRADAQFFTWIYRITVNQSLTYLKSRARWSPLPDASDEESPGREFGVTETQGAGVEESDEQQRVWKALETLSPELRAAAVLVYLQDQSPKEASKTLGCAEATVHWRLFKVRKQLKKVLS